MESIDKITILKNKIAYDGLHKITDIELLAIILGKGIISESTLAKSESLMEKMGTIENFEQENISKISTIKLSDRLFVETLTEFGQRIKTHSNKKVEIINTNLDIVNIFKPMLAALHHEELWVICLTSANRVIEKFLLSKGSGHSTVFDIKILMKRVIDNLSSSIILVHNHPNGDITPSIDDFETTTKIETALEYFEIILIDHIIITKEKDYSFREHGKL